MLTKIPNTCNGGTYITQQPANPTFIDPRFSKPHVITPYLRVIAFDDTQPFWVDGLENNYTHYDFFILTTRLRHVITEGFIEFYFYQWETVMKAILEIEKDGVLMESTPHRAHQLQRQVDQILERFPRHCCLFYVQQPFYHNKILNKTWLVTILPYMLHLIDKKYNPIMYDNQILVNLNNTNDYFNYQQIHANLQALIINEAYNLYTRGAVILNKSLQQSFIDQYGLTPWMNGKDETQVYIAKDLMVDGNKTEYLLLQLRMI